MIPPGHYYSAAKSSPSESSLSVPKLTVSFTQQDVGCSFELWCSVSSMSISCKRCLPLISEEYWSILVTIARRSLAMLLHNIDGFGRKSFGNFYPEAYQSTKGLLGCMWPTLLSALKRWQISCLGKSMVYRRLPKSQQHSILHSHC